MANYRTAYIILDILTVMLFVALYLPQFVLLSYHYQIEGLLALGIAMIIFHFDKFKMLRANSFLAILIVFLAFSLLIPLFSGHTVIFNRYLSMTVSTIFLFVCLFNEKYRGNHVNMRLLLVLFVIVLYPFINTLAALINNSYTVRAIKSTMEEGDASFIAAQNGIMGYPLVYSVLLAHIIVLFVLQNRKSLRIKNFPLLVLLVFLVASFFLILLSNFFTALAILLLADLAIIVAVRQRWALIAFIPVIILYLIFSDSINDFIVDAVASFLPEGKTVDRLDAIAHGGSSLGELDSRALANKASIDLISRFPFTGYILHYDFDLENVGQHSYVLDTLAFYGVFIGFLPILFFASMFMYFYRKSTISILNRFTVVFFLAAAVLLLRNNYTSTIGLMLFFVFPAVHCFYLDRSAEIKQ